MANARLYVDTSVVSAYFDEHDIGRREATVEFWSALKSVPAAVSPIVVEELSDTPDVVRREKLLALVRGLQHIEWTPEMASLSDKYLAAGVFRRRTRRDGYHVAACTVAQIPVLVSWNFRHLVNRQRRVMINLVNIAQGYNQIEIISPPEWR